MAKISIPKNHIESLTPQQIQELPYPQHLINDLLQIQQDRESNYIIQRDVNDAYIQVPTNDFIPKFR